ncbi:MAG: S-formylglutathione hydrolase [Symbiobacteriaceae bacterium]|jgi:S-formylglutathione hydrolase FrmB|nr:S-formylglutathione hydrolase [Symbiobacteriaceae bacterium]
MQFHSAALRRQVTYTAILPDNQQGPAPVVMMLHGFSDDHTAWINFSNLVRHARQYPFIIVLPDGGISFYLNAHPAMMYEDFLIQDLYTHVNATLQAKPGPWAIGGLSMGGYGALRLGARYPGRFASVWAHSSAFFRLEEMPGLPMEPADADIYAMTAALGAGQVRPVISFDCGTEDFLIEHNRRMHAHLEEVGVAHRYFEHPGAHTWEYWDEHVREALRQHAEVLL